MAGYFPFVPADDWDTVVHQVSHSVQELHYQLIDSGVLADVADILSAVHLDFALPVAVVDKLRVAPVALAVGASHTDIDTVSVQVVLEYLEYFESHPAPAFPAHSAVVVAEVAQAVGAEAVGDSPAALDRLDDNMDCQPSIIPFSSFKVFTTKTPSYPSTFSPTIQDTAMPSTL